MRICGIITLVYLYNLGQKLHGHRFGWLWALAYLGSVTPHLYFRSGIIDPFFNLFIFIGLVNLIFASWKRERLGGAMTVPKSEWTYILLGGFVLGLAIMTKGPVAYLIVCLVLVVYWMLSRFRWFISPVQFLAFSAAAAVVSLAWYGLDIYLHGPALMQEFLAYNFRLFSTPDAGHVGFPGYHIIILLVGCFPASIFAIRAFGPLFIERNYQREFRKWMLILFWVVLVLFSIVQSKIVHYSSLCYFPLTYFAALTLLATGGTQNTVQQLDAGGSDSDWGHLRSRHCWNAHTGASHGYRQNRMPIRMHFRRGIWTRKLIGQAGRSCRAYGSL